MPRWPSTNWSPWPREYPQIRDFHYWAQFPGESVESGSERIQYMADHVIPAVTDDSPATHNPRLRLWDEMPLMTDIVICNPQLLGLCLEKEGLCGGKALGQ